MTTWSDWIPLKGCQYPDDAEVQLGPRSRFRVKIGPDGWSDWIGWNGGECPVSDDCLVLVQLLNENIFKREAGRFAWTSSGYHVDIIAFKVQAAKLYRAADLPAIYAAMVAHIEAIQAKEAA